MTQIEKSIFLIKPSGLTTTIGKHSLQELTLGLFNATQLKVERISERQLNESDIRNIYPILNIPDEEFGESWKEEVIEHLSERPVVSFLLSGESATKKAKIIKNQIRSSRVDQTSYQSKVVKNFAHVADIEDFNTSYKILFGD